MKFLPLKLALLLDKISRVMRYIPGLYLLGGTVELIYMKDT